MPRIDPRFTGKVKAVEDALDTLFSDTTVEPETTLDALEEIETRLHEKIEALRVDCRDRHWNS